MKWIIRAGKGGNKKERERKTEIQTNGRINRQPDRQNGVAKESHPSDRKVDQS